MEIMKALVVILLGFFVYASAFGFSVAALIYGWGLSPVNWWWVILPAFATMFFTVFFQILCDVIKGK